MAVFDGSMEEDYDILDADSFLDPYNTVALITAATVQLRDNNGPATTEEIKNGNQDS